MKKNRKDTIMKIAIYTIIVITITGLISCAVMAGKGYEDALLPLSIGLVLIYLIYAGVNIACKTGVPKRNLVLLFLCVIGVVLCIAWMISGR